MWWSRSPIAFGVGGGAVGAAAARAGAARFAAGFGPAVDRGAAFAADAFGSDFVTLRFATLPADFFARAGPAFRFAILDEPPR
jgi:hypothetical protein